MVFNRSEQYNAYNVASLTVPKTRQIVMLYDGIIRLCQQARLAVEEKRIEDRFNLLLKAAEVVMGLQASLDFENGGEVAPILNNYYSSIDARLLYVQRTNDLRILDSVIAELKQMRGAWGDIDARASVPVSDTAPAVEGGAQKEAIRRGEAAGAGVSEASLSPAMHSAGSAPFFVSV